MRTRLAMAGFGAMPGNVVILPKAAIARRSRIRRMALAGLGADSGDLSIAQAMGASSAQLNALQAGQIDLPTLMNQLTGNYRAPITPQPASWPSMVSAGAQDLFADTVVPLPDSQTLNTAANLFNATVLPGAAWDAGVSTGQAVGEGIVATGQAVTAVGSSIGQWFGQNWWWLVIAGIGVVVIVKKL